MKDKHHPTKHSYTVPYATGVPELSQISFPLLPRIYKLGIQTYVSDKLSDKTHGTKCLTMHTQIWKPFNNQTQIIVPKPQDKRFSHFMKNTCKNSILIPKCVCRLFTWKTYFFISSKNHISTNMTSIQYHNLSPV